MTQTKATEPATSAKPVSGFDRYFGITALGSNIPRELRPGFTTWLTMSYILFVNPQVLSGAIDVPNGFNQLLTTTCLAAAFGSLAMGIVARYPFAQAPGMGLNAFFAYSVVGAMGYRGRPPSVRCSSPVCCSWCSASPALDRPSSRPSRSA